MSNIGFATLSIIPSMRGAQAALGGQATAAGAGAGRTAGSAFAGALGTALKVGGAAAIGTAIKGVLDFTSFERQMNEVFTLLPGISGDAMSAMTEQVKGFSTEFGVLPNDVVPALYQSLSAGVPQDNVFEFLEVAQKAAKGGVAELTTAVDGISSVVNAYGSDVISATEASDLMFTAVRLGKTNFEELSGSLFNVLPSASALGVGFEDVTASIASLTAMGVPTSVATTQMRAALDELGKDGSVAFDAFKEASGQTFPEFIAAGGDLGGAVGIMKEAAEGAGTSVRNLFAAEGGAAFNALSGDLEGFTSNLDEMNGSAGATEAAFDQMNQGLGPIFDKFKAHLAVFFIDIGQKLAPAIEGGIAVAGQLFDILFRGDFKGGPFSEDSGVVDFFFDLRDVGLTVADIFQTTIIPAFQDLADFIIGTAVPALVSFGGWIIDNKPVLIGALTGLATAVGVVLVPAFVAWASAAAIAAINTALAAAPFVAIGLAVAALAAGIIWAYQNWEGFRNVIDSVAAFLVDTAWPAIQKVADVLVDAMVVAFDAASDAATWLWNNVLKPTFQWVQSTLFPIVRTLATVHFAVLKTAFTAISTAAGWLWRNVLTPAFNWIRSTLFPIVQTLIGAQLGALSTAFGAVSTAAGWLWNNVLKPVGRWLVNTFKGQITRIRDAWNGVKTAVDNIAGFGAVAFDGLVSAIDKLVGPLATVVGAAQDAYNWLKSALDLGNSGLGTLAINAANSINSSGGSTKNPPEFHGGGRAPGAAGSEVLAILQGQEAVFTTEQQGALIGMLTGATDLMAAGGNTNLVAIGGATGVDSARSGRERGGMHFHGPVSFGDSKVVPDIDFWLKSQGEGM